MIWRYAVLLLFVALNILFLSALLWGEQGITRYTILYAEYGALCDELTALEQREQALKREIELLETDISYVEKMIRKRLNFVKDNEVIYLFSVPK